MNFLRIILAVIVGTIYSINVQGYQVDGICYSIVTSSSYWHEPFAMVVNNPDGYRDTVEIPGLYYGEQWPDRIVERPLYCYVIEIDDDAFKGCDELTKVFIPYSMVFIGYNAFEGCTKLEEISLPHTVKKVGNSAFKDCSNLKSIQLSNSMNEIPVSMLEGCRMLTEITLPTSIKEIKSKAFYCCHKLKSISIGEQVERIGANAFDLTSINKVICYATVPPVCEENAFDLDKSKPSTLIVPKGFIDAYKNADQWKDFSNIVDDLSLATQSYKPIYIMDDKVHRDASVDVYNLQGVKVKSQVLYKDLDEILPKGVYIVNGRKVVVE